MTPRERIDKTNKSFITDTFFGAWSSSAIYNRQYSKILQLVETLVRKALNISYSMSKPHVTVHSGAVSLVRDKSVHIRTSRVRLPTAGTVQFG